MELNEYVNMVCSNSKKGTWQCFSCNVLGLTVSIKAWQSSWVQRLQVSGVYYYESSPCDIRTKKAFKEWLAVSLGRMLREAGASECA